MQATPSALLGGFGSLDHYVTITNYAMQTGHVTSYAVVWTYQQHYLHHCIWACFDWMLAYVPRPAAVHTTPVHTCRAQPQQLIYQHCRQLPSSASGLGRSPVRKALVVAAMADLAEFEKTKGECCAYVSTRRQLGCLRCLWGILHTSRSLDEP